MRRGSKHGIDWDEYMSRIHEFTKRGADLPQSKLTPEIVRRLRETTYVIPARVWAEQLGVSKSTVERARFRGSWTHVK